MTEAPEGLERTYWPLENMREVLQTPLRPIVIFWVQHERILGSTMQTFEVLIKRHFEQFRDRSSEAIKCGPLVCLTF